MIPSDPHYTLEGSEVIRTTQRALLVRYTDGEGTQHEFWVARSLCENGEDIRTGDIDVAVAEWWVADNELDR